MDVTPCKETPMKFYILFTLLLLPFTALASGGHNHNDGDTTTTTTTITDSYNTEITHYHNQVMEESDSIQHSASKLGDTIDQAMAMIAAADYCVFDYAKGWQGCVAAGFYNGYTGYNFQTAKRIDEFMLRFGIQTDQEFEDAMYGIGASWHF